MLCTGVDLIEIERVQRAIDRHGDRFLMRVFTLVEIAQSCRRSESLAGRFAAKEAVAKALGTGIWRHGITWTDIETVKDAVTGAPSLQLHRNAAARAKQLGLAAWSVSISHDRSHAVALAVAMATG